MNSTYHWFIPKSGEMTGADREPQVVRVDGDIVWFFGMTDSLDKKELRGWFGPALPKPNA